VVGQIKGVSFLKFHFSVSLFDSNFMLRTRAGIDPIMKAMYKSGLSGDTSPSLSMMTAQNRGRNAWHCQAKSKSCSFLDMIRLTPMNEHDDNVITNL